MEENKKPAQIAATTLAIPPHQTQWAELKDQATMAFQSGLLPKSIDSAQKAVVVALAGRELGLAPMAALCGIYVVNGMVALRGSLMLRLIYERVPGASITILTPTDRCNAECEVEMKRPNGVPQRFKFTLDDAKRGGFTNKPIWQQHTATMLRWAAIRTGARIVFADALAGCYMEDELPSAPQAGVMAAPEAPVTQPQPQISEPPQEAEYREQPQLPPAEPPAPPQLASDRTITEKQLNRLYAIAHAKNISRTGATNLIRLNTGKTDPMQMTRAEYEKTCNQLLQSEVQPPATSAEEGQAQNQKAAERTEAPISQAQSKRLYAIAKSHGFSNEEIGDVVEHHTGQRHTMQIPWTKYNEICEFFEENKPEPQDNRIPF